jgi:epoxyqueuosine reductase
MAISTSEAPRQIRARALAAGFDAVGFALPEAGREPGARLRTFLAEGRHGEMAWLEAKAGRRADPNVLWPEARSIVSLGINYGPAHDPLAGLARRRHGVISVYAQGGDYHDLIKRKLKAVGRWIGETFAADVKVFVDTAPVMEKPLAQAAALGWLGKHTNLVSTAFGSWLFLGEIFTTLDLVPDAPHADRCGTCRACLDVCPTAAFPAPYQLDARRCISYLTIEHKGHIAAEFRAAIGNRIYGCDDCLAVCPWNKYAAATKERALQPRAELTAPLLADLACLDDAAFRTLFAVSPIKRTGRDRFVRNVLIALGNSGDRQAVPVVEERLGDASPLVRAMAVWALSRLLEAREFAKLRAMFLPGEADSDVRAEWNEGND